MLIVVFVVLWSGEVRAEQRDDSIPSFNGYVLESPVSGVESMNVVEHYSTEFVQDVTVYEKPGEPLILDAVPLKTVRYRCANGLLESIQLTYKGRENREKLLSWVEENYGKLPSKERRIVSQVMWHGEKLLIMLTYNRSNDQGTLWFVSPSLHREINRTTGSIPD
ncbi:MAG TPA: hypothetical protein VGJ57_05450 [Nitrospirales bacterium]